MSSSLYLDHYLDSLESLPVELQRNFTLMRDLDKRTQDLMRDIDRHADEYLKQVQNLSSEKRTDQVDKIQNLFDKTKEYGDDKVQLAIQTYELVDKHIRRLDADLARFEADMKEKAIQSQSSDSDTQKSKKLRKNQEKDKKSKTRATSSDDEQPKSRKKQKNQAQPEVQFTGGNSLTSIAHPSDVLDMPVDPNEPTYCLCHQVSYGEMIGCDNTECPIEWFHFACVGLTSKPKGKWYCPKCTAERKKK